MLLDEGLENVFARHHAHRRQACAPPWAPGGWSSAPPRRTSIPTRSARSARRKASTPPTSCQPRRQQTYGVAFGVGLGEVAGKVFRIGHLGSPHRRDDPVRASPRRKCAWPISASTSRWARALPPRRNTIAGMPSRPGNPQPEDPVIMKDTTDVISCQPIDDMLAAHERIKPHINRKTPVLHLGTTSTSYAGCGAVLQMRKLPGAGGLQGPRRLQRGVRAEMTHRRKLGVCDA